MRLVASRAHFYGSLPGHEKEGNCAFLFKTCMAQKTRQQCGKKRGSTTWRRTGSIWSASALHCLLGFNWGAKTSLWLLLDEGPKIWETKIEIRRTGQIGYDEECSTEMVVLKRESCGSTQTSERLSWKRIPDTCLLRMSTMEKCKQAATSRQRLGDATQLLDREANLKYISGTMKSDCFAVGRLDISQTLEQAMRKPRESHVGLLGSLVWYVAGLKRMVTVYGKQNARDVRSEILVDPGWAGGARGVDNGQRGWPSWEDHISWNFRQRFKAAPAFVRRRPVLRGACFWLGVQSYFQGKEILVEIDTPERGASPWKDTETGNDAPRHAAILGRFWRGSSWTTSHWSASAGSNVSQSWWRKHWPKTNSCGKQVVAVATRPVRKAPSWAQAASIVGVNMREMKGQKVFGSGIPSWMRYASIL